MKITSLFVSMIWITISITSCHESDLKEKEQQLRTLGRYLFFEKRLSVNQSKSCGSCHDPQLAFTDGYRRSVSALGENLKHNSPSLLNTQTYRLYDWANPTASDYIGQMQRPLYSHAPVELGLNKHWAEVKKFLEEDSLYATLFKRAFNQSKAEATQANIHEALAAYLNTLKTENSVYHQYLRGNKNVLAASALNGLKLFESEKLQCAICHTPPSFTLNDTNHPNAELFVNIGLYNIQNQNTYPEGDQGIIAFSKKKSDDGKYKIPSLLNIAVTSPYMHDGSVQTLEEVIEIYSRGGRLIQSGPMAGDGALHKNKHPLIKGFSITPEEKSDLVAFLHSLTDTSYLRQEHFQNPFRVNE